MKTKLQRAQFHLEIAREEIGVWLKTKCRYQLAHERNDDFTEYRIVLRTNGIDPPLDFWCAIIGDCLGNLRAALDHLVWAIAVKESFPSEPLKANSRYFIIADTSSEFKSELRKIDTLSAAVQTAIESVQPYHRPHAFLPPPLSILRVLSNTDKHKLVAVATTLPKIWDGKFSGPTDPSIERQFYVSHGPLVEGAELAAVISSKSDPNMSLVPGSRVGFCVAMWTGFNSDGKGLRSEDWVEVTFLLDVLIKEVAEVVSIVARAA